MSETKKFNGELYHRYIHSHGVKQVAQQWAQELRKEGKKVRITKGKSNDRKKRTVNLLWIRNK